MTTDSQIPPGTNGLPIVGETLAFLKSPVEFGNQRRARFGSVFRSNLLGKPTIFMSGPKANQWVFSGEEKYLKNRWIITIRELLGKNSLAMINGEEHRKRRAMLMPHFKYENMAAFTSAIADISRAHLARWAEQGNLAIAPAMRALAFDIIAAFIFGEQRKTLDLPWLSSQFTTWTSGMFAVPIQLPFTPFGKAKQARQRMFDYIADIVRERRANPTPSPDMLNTLLNTRDDKGQPLPDATIIDDLQLLLFAGHDTTVSSNTNIMMLLAQNPDWLAQAQAEQARFSDEDLLNLEKLKQMAVLDSIIMEGLRLVPPVAGVFRETTEDTHFGEYSIPKGWAVTLNPGATHHDASIYPEPQCFDPARYERGEHKQQPFSHIAFGGGPRLCLGQNFAMVEMRLILASALRHYQWSILPDQDLTMQVLPLPLPKSGLLVEFKAR